MTQQSYTEPERMALEDMIAFLEHCLRTGEYGYVVALRTLHHDVEGLAHPDPTFLPRTFGYAKKNATESAAS